MIDDLIDFIFPRRCISCEVILAKSQNFLCEFCKNDLPLTYWKLNTENLIYKKLGKEIPLESACASFYFYEGSVSQKLIHSLKYKRQDRVGNLLAYYLFENIRNATHKPDCIVPVPIHPKKLKIRGYNQLDILGERLAEKMNVDYIKDALQRNTHQESQTQKGKLERAQRLKNTFSVLNADDIIGKHVLLIDDVFTTGSTLLNCGKNIISLQNTKLSVATVCYVK